MLLLPLVYFLCIKIICQIHAQNNKQCTNCKYFIPYKNNKISDFGLCKLFGNKVGDKKNEKIIYNFAKHCRDDENLCGKNASLYVEIKQNVNNTFIDNNTTKENSIKIMEDEMKILINDYYKFLRNDNDW
jgi:hypothetical protein